MRRLIRWLTTWPDRRVLNRAAAADEWVAGVLDAADLTIAWDPYGFVTADAARDLDRIEDEVAAWAEESQ